MCVRTPQVRDTKVSATGLNCGTVSEFDLLGVVAVDLEGEGIPTLDAEH